MRSDLASRLQHAIISIAADGWTNVRHQKVTNVVLMQNGAAYYWRSIVNVSDRNTAEWLAEHLLPILQTLISDHHARIIAYVVDNEAVNAATHRIMCKELPFLILVPCAAHTIQLIVNDCLNTEPYTATKQQLLALVRHFEIKANRLELLNLQAARKLPTLAVLKPCDTRWSSVLLAANRMLKMQKEIACCFTAASLPEVQADFFSQLETFAAFLLPFRVATDAVQSDNATLYTVFEQFQLLSKHAADSHAVAATSVLKRWDNFINVDATVACAILSFIRPPAPLSIQAGQQFIVDFGSAYLEYYKLSRSVHLVDATREQIAAALTLQIADFNGREGVFADLSKQIAVVKSATTINETWSPRKVWLWYEQSVDLAAVAIALLSVAASEAAVERTFSAQALVHNKRRNALSSDAVESEMFLKFNARAMNSNAASIRFGYCRELPADADDEDLQAAAEDDIATEAGEQMPVEQPQQRMQEDSEVEDELEDEPASAAAAAAATSSRRRLKRQPSIIFDNVSDFIAWIIQELELKSLSDYNKETLNSLERHSSKLRSCPSSKELEKLLKAALASISH